ncbi:M23 family metallopeptidase [Henriciella aquimarina]|uniref:M23 family metallopeptidase n=1 Tax=Henriciella aquimarina TaxID=545261 RepID=UPI000A00DD93|nr:M23 family metallopeptidase [Henriciella aquimarina]
MKNPTMKVRELFSRLFPERQIYHRSGGTVRYFTVSPLQQAVLAVAVAAAVGWSLFATANLVFLPKQSTIGSGQYEIDKYERWVQELRARDALSRSQLVERTEAFQEATVNFERRHQTLEVLLNTLKNGGELEASALRGNDAPLLVNVSIDEADRRQSRPSSGARPDAANVGLRGQINDIEEEQQAFLNEVEEIAVERAETARGVLRLTAVGSNRIEDNREMGGPLIEFASLAKGKFDSPEEAAFAERVAQVAARMEEARYYQDVVDNLPLAGPVGVPWRITSNYGLRVDPFNKRPGWHNGLDIGAYWNAPITATGPGKISFAGVKSGYGRIVEVDHGHGFKSRYAHLKRINVKKGDTVAIGDVVGAMGSTGRSTGPHLHYEVWFNGKPYDPVDFLKAGKHVHED